MPRRPDRQIMTSNGEMIQGCNCQAVLDGDHQVIVVVGVSNQPPEARPTAIGHDRPTAKEFGRQRPDGPQVAHQERA